MFEAAIASAVGMATPLLLAALGELLVENAGMFNIGIEGVMLVGAFAAMATAYMTGSLALALAAAAVSGALLCGLLGVMAINFGVNQVVAGTALNMLALGGTGVLYRRLFGVTGTALIVRSLPDVALGPLARLPLVGRALFHRNPLIYLALLAVPLFSWMLYHTRWGLTLRASGENPTAADALGLNVYALRWQALIASGILTGVGGAYLTLVQSNTFVEGMTAGRGFVALAIVMVGRWAPAGVAWASLLMGAALALQFLLQAGGSRVPYQLFLALPYVLALVVLVVLSAETRAPSALGEPYIRR